MKKKLFLTAFLLINLIACNFSLALDEKRIYPHNAMIVLSKEGDRSEVWDQKIIENVTQKILIEDNYHVVIKREPPKKIGAEERTELFASFKSNKLLPELPGYLVIAFIPSGTGILKIDSIYIRVKYNNISLMVKGSSDAKVSVWLYYSQKLRIVKHVTIFGNSVIERQILNTLRFRNQFVNDFRLKCGGGLDEGISLRSSFLNELRKLSACALLFEKLDGTFNESPQISNLWDFEKVSVAKLKDVIIKAQTHIANRLKGPINVAVHAICRAFDFELGSSNIRYDVTKEYVFQGHKEIGIGLVEVRVLTKNYPHLEYK